MNFSQIKLSKRGIRILKIAKSVGCRTQNSERQMRDKQAGIKGIHANKHWATSLRVNTGTEGAWCNRVEGT